jgi:hypothetical protein
MIVSPECHVQGASAAFLPVRGFVFVHYEAIRAQSHKLAQPALGGIVYFSEQLSLQVHPAAMRMRRTYTGILCRIAGNTGFQYADSSLPNALPEPGVRLYVRRVGQGSSKARYAASCAVGPTLVTATSQPRW